MGKLIYFIGGASASGKSTVTKKLSDIGGHKVVALDDLHKFIRAAMQDLKASQSITRKTTVRIVEEFLKCGTICIIEGGWILPDQAKELMEKYGEQFYPVFCGYPNADASKRVKLIKRRKSHWLCKTPQEYRQTWVQDQIEGSRWYQDECAKYQIPFFDFSNVEEGSRALILNYMEWCGMEASQVNLPLENSVKENRKFGLTRARNFLRRLTKH